MWVPRMMGEGVAPGNHAGAGQRLQNAHAGRRTLDGHRNGQAGQQAQNGVLQLGEQVHEQLRFPQAATADSIWNIPVNRMPKPIMIWPMLRFLGAL